MKRIIELVDYELDGRTCRGLSEWNTARFKFKFLFLSTFFFVNTVTCDLYFVSVFTNLCRKRNFAPNVTLRTAVLVRIDPSAVTARGGQSRWRLSRRCWLDRLIDSIDTRQGQGLEMYCLHLWLAGAIKLIDEPHFSLCWLITVAAGW